MKCLILVVGLLLIQVGDADRKFNPEETCTTELQLSRKRMKAFVNEDNTSENNRVCGKFLICVFRKRHVINLDGTINENGLLSFINHILVTTIYEPPTTAAKEILDKCKGIHKSHTRKTAISLKNCIVKNLKQMYSDY